MIKANELRIGNYIFLEVYPDLPRPHCIMPKDIYDISQGRVTLNAIEGIKLIPQILEKSGFEELQQSNGWFCIYGLEGLELSVNTNNFEICIDKQYQIYLGKNFPVKYLHQLQNLYFALAGQELEINL